MKETIVLWIIEQEEINKNEIDQKSMIKDWEKEIREKRNENRNTRKKTVRSTTKSSWEAFGGYRRRRNFA